MEIGGGINRLVLAILNIEQKYWELSPHEAWVLNSYTVSDTKALQVHLWNFVNWVTIQSKFKIQSFKKSRAMNWADHSDRFWGTI